MQCILCMLVDVPMLAVQLSEKSPGTSNTQLVACLLQVPLGHADEEVCIESQIGHVRLADLETSRGYGHPQVHVHQRYIA